MTLAESRRALHVAIERMETTSTALAERVTPDRLREYVDAANDAQTAHHALLLAALERAKRTRGER
jgi:hypothetical protein